MGRHEFVAKRGFGKGLRRVFRNLYRVFLWRVASEGVGEKAATPEKFWVFVETKGLRTSMVDWTERESERGGRSYMKGGSGERNRESLNPG